MLISDVHVSKDGVVLMFHDPGLSSIMSVRGVVVDWWFISPCTDNKLNGWGWIMMIMNWLLIVP